MTARSGCFMLTRVGGRRTGQSCKNLGSVVALLQDNFEKSQDFKANFEGKRAVLMRLQKFDDNFLPLNSITNLCKKNPKTFDHTHTFHGQTYRLTNKAILPFAFN